jgi:hypothetical protein
MTRVQSTRCIQGVFIAVVAAVLYNFWLNTLIPANLTLGRWSLVTDAVALVVGVMAGLWTSSISLTVLAVGAGVVAGAVYNVWQLPNDIASSDIVGSVLWFAATMWSDVAWLLVATAVGAAGGKTVRRRLGAGQFSGAGVNPRG